MHLLQQCDAAKQLHAGPALRRTTCAGTSGTPGVHLYFRAQAQEPDAPSRCEGATHGKCQ